MKRVRSRWSRWAAPVGALAVAVLAAAVSRARTSAGDPECLVRSTRLAARGVDLRWSSPGGDEETACTDRAANGALAKLEAAVAALPQGDIFPRVTVRFARAPGGRVREPRFDSLAGELRVDPASQALADESIWLHELAHGRAHAPSQTAISPSNAGSDDLVVTRVRLAIEEAAADYFSASTLRDTRVGAVDGREPRDLARLLPLPLPLPLPAATTAWTTLPLARAPFAPHELGAPLAAALFARHGFDVSLAGALLDALRNTPAAGLRSPRQLVATLAARAPERRDEVHAVLLSWLPPSLRDERQSP